MKDRLLISDILEYLDGKDEKYLFYGNRDLYVNGFSSLAQYKTGSFTWIKNRASIEKTVPKCSLTLAVIQEGVGLEPLKIENKIVTGESKRVFFDVIEHFYEDKQELAPIGQGTYVSPKVKLGKNVVIGHNCTIDGDITIGDDTRIYDNVVIINRVNIGKNCAIQSGTTIGHDGFSYTESTIHGKKMIKHYGGVNIGDDVLVGANVAIARGTIDDTSIGNNCKIDNLCHIAHNAIIRNSVGIVAGSLIYGSAQLGDNAYVASAIVKNQLTVGQNAFVGMGSVVTKDVEANTTVAGVPAKKLKEK